MSNQLLASKNKLNNFIVSSKNICFCNITNGLKLKPRNSNITLLFNEQNIKYLIFEFRKLSGNGILYINIDNFNKKFIITNNLLIKIPYSENVEIYRGADSVGDVSLISIYVDATDSEVFKQVKNAKEKKVIIDRSLKIKIHVGIGDCIITKAQLAPIVGTRGKIYISPQLEAIRSYKANYNEYLDFILNFMKLIFFEEEFEITIDQSYKTVDCVSLTRMGRPAKYINLIPALTTNDKYITENYITLNTKIRGIQKNNFEKIKINLFKILNNSNKKIVLIGEKDVHMNEEYKLLGDEYIYSIYSEVMKHLNSEKIIDMTIPPIKTPSIVNIKRDCTVMKNADRNFILGIGGNLFLANSVGKTYAYINDLGNKDMVGLIRDYYFHNPLNFMTNNATNLFNTLTMDVL